MDPLTKHIPDDVVCHLLDLYHYGTELPTAAAYGQYIENVWHEYNTVYSVKFRQPPTEQLHWVCRSLPEVYAESHQMLFAELEYRYALLESREEAQHLRSTAFTHRLTALMPDCAVLKWLRAYDIVADYSGCLDLFQVVLLREWREEQPNIGSTLSDFVLIEVGALGQLLNRTDCLCRC